MSAPESGDQVLVIHLGEQLVGELVLRGEDQSEFRLAREYLELAHRPVLGQVFEDDLTATHRARMKVPPFFSNLLPEGRLRRLVADAAKVSVEREFFLLARLGADLPGDVRATARTPVVDSGKEAPLRPDAPEAGPLKFSLAGVQLKLSMIHEGRGMTLAAGGTGGDWIVKLPGGEFQGVPENEFATMSWAREVGIQVPEIALVQVRDLRGLPAGVSTEQGVAFAVRRFDRPEPGRRIHIEDFAQIRNQYPHDKYGATNYETLGKLILRIAGQASFEEFVRRLAFHVVSANADAHLKNWSLIYPDRIHPELSPAYDLVSTLEFIGTDALALNLARTKVWNELSLGHFERFAQKVGADPVAVTSIVQTTVERALDAWPAIRRDLPVSAVLSQRLEAHWRGVPLLGELRGSH